MPVMLSWWLVTEISVRVLAYGTGLTRFFVSFSHPLLLYFPAKHFQLFLFSCSMPSSILSWWNCLPDFYFVIPVLHCTTSVPLCRKNGTNCGQTVPKKWVIHCIHSFVPFFSFFFPSLAFLPCPSKPRAAWWHDMLCGKGSQFGNWFFLFF